MWELKRTAARIEAEQVNLFLDRFLVAWLFLVVIGVVVHLLAVVQRISSSSDRLFLALDLGMVLVLSAATILRRRFTRVVKTSILVAATGFFAVLSFYFNGLIGNGAVLVCIFILIAILFLDGRGGALAALIGFLLLPLFGLFVKLGILEYDSVLIDRLNSPLSWTFNAIAIAAFSLVTWYTINQFRRSIIEQIDALQQANRSLRRQDKKLERLAYIDPLTGLPNRSSFQKHVTERIEAGESEAFLVLIDIRGFRIFNSLMGTDLGDAVLHSVANVMRADLTARQFLARLGADEFALWIPDRGESGLDAGFRAFREKLDKIVVAKSSEYRIDFVIAAARYPENGDQFEDILRKASVALRRAKEEDSREIVFFDKSIATEIEGRHKLQELLTRAIENNEFEVAYQPKIDIVTGATVGVEALARWNTVELGPVGPDRFIPELARMNAMVPFSRLLFERILSRVADVRQRFGEGITISINVSPIIFMRPRFASHITERCREYGVDPATFVIEITEDVFVENISLIQNVVTELSALGVKVALDDFGKGFSSLYFINNVRFNELKVDRSFVKGIVDNPQSLRLFRSICDIAENFGFEVVAEGVETKQQIDLLARTSCHIAQGYYYARPEIL